MTQGLNRRHILGGAGALSLTAAHDTVVTLNAPRGSKLPATVHLRAGHPWRL